MRNLLFLPALLIASVALSAGGAITIESLDGSITPKELRSFKDTLAAEPLPTNNFHNAMVYGSAGQNVEAAGLVYEATHDRELLDIMLKITDAMLAARNDPVTGRILFTGKRELTWPNKREDEATPTYTATENGDVVGHIAYAALLILQDKSLANQTISSGDPHHYGATYLERANTYVRELDKTMDTFIVPQLVDPKSHLLIFPSGVGWNAIDDRSAAGAGKPAPWNQQMMLDNGFQRMAICHELLGDAPDRVKNYDAIVKASCDDFFNQVTTFQVDGHDCYKWSYNVEGKTLKHIEDSGHAGYDILIYRAYASHRYGITKEQMLPFINTLRYAMYQPATNDFARRVDGAVDKSNPKLTPRPGAGGSWLYFSQLDPSLYEFIAKPSVGRAARDPASAGYILWAKNNHYLADEHKEAR